MAEDGDRDWSILVIGGGAATGKSSAARAIAELHHISVLPLDAIWIALKAATDPASHPELHYFDPTDEELSLTQRSLCERHIESSIAISRTVDPVIEYYLWERWPVVLEGAWVTPVAAKRWTRQSASVRAVFVHEPDQDKVLASMLERSDRQRPTHRQEILAEVCWLYSDWARQQALIESLPVVESSPRATLVERILAAI